MQRITTFKDISITIVFIIVTWLILSEYDAFEELVEYLESHEEYELDELLLLLIIMGFYSIIFTIRRVSEAIAMNKHFMELNDELKKRVDDEVSKQREQEHLLIQQTKLASMGEMIGNIAHQWRQPLNALSLITQNIHFEYKTGNLNDEFMDDSIARIKNLTQNMSKTIDDFRSFYSPNKELEIFNLSESMNKTLSLIDAALITHKIKVINKSKGEINATGYSNEFSQVLVNILNNAKDVLMERKIEKAEITIWTSRDANFAYTHIEDNAGGIPKDIVEKIFNPYFTTKDEGKGTGIGLYMSKIMIEKNMKGFLDIKNTKNGALFTIALPLKRDINYEKNK